MRNKFLLAVCLGVCVFVAGCSGNKEAALVGTWKIKDVKLPASVPMNAETTKKLDEAKAKFSMIFKADHHFSIEDNSGTWVLGKDSVTMTTTTIKGKSVVDIKKEMEAQLKGNPALQKLVDAQLKPQVGTFSTDMKTMTIVQSTPPAGDTTLTLIKADK